MRLVLVQFPTLSFLLIPQLLAQTAQIAGIISDQSGGAVAGAEVTLRNNATGAQRTATSDESGRFHLASLAHGSYRLQILAQHFDPAIQDDLQLRVSQVRKTAFTLRLGLFTTQIVVSSSPFLELSDAAVQTTINPDIVPSVIHNGRGLQTLIGFSPGVVVTPESFYSLGQFSVNGQSPTTNYTTIDGISGDLGITPYGNARAFIHAAPGFVTEGLSQSVSGSIQAKSVLGTSHSLASMEEIQEVNVQTSTFASEIGRTPGAQISIVTKSGKDTLSGSLYEYVRNDHFDAADWFANSLWAAKQPYRFHDFGGTIGGPVRRIKGGGGIYFFASREQIRILQPQPPRGYLVPSKETRAGVPALVRQFFDAIPLPDAPTASSDWYPQGYGRVTAAYSSPSDLSSTSVRLDHSTDSRVRLFGRYSYSPSSVATQEDSNPANYSNYSDMTRLGVVGLTHIIAPDRVNDLRLGLGRQRSELFYTVGGVSGVSPPADEVLFPRGYSLRDSLVRYDAGTVITKIGRESRNEITQFQIIDNFSMMLGTHRVKFGADYRRLTPHLVGPRLSYTGRLEVFDGSYTGMMEGVVVGGSRQMELVTPSFSAYAQNTWRARKRGLAATFGVRWEINPSPRSSTMEGLPTASIAPPRGGGYQISELVKASVVSRRGPLYPTQFTNIAPRLGIAWRIADGDKSHTTMRSGWGVYFDLAQGGFANVLEPASSSVLSRMSLPLELSTLSHADVYTTSHKVAVAALPGFSLPRIYQWNVTLEQALSRNVVRVGYVGSLGRGLVGQGQMMDLNLVGNIGSSSYNALQVQYSRPLASGVHALISYSWSHSIDNVPNVIGDLRVVHDEDSDWRTLWEFLNPSINRGSSDFDVRHSGSGTVLWKVPWPRRMAGLSKRIFGGWSTAATWFARSAPPSNIVTGVQACNIIVEDESTIAIVCPRPPLDMRRPDVVFGVPLYVHGSALPGGKRINPAAFTIPFSDDPAIQGTLGRNSLRLFGAWQVDAVVERTFELAGKGKIQLRVEALNAFNHPNFANPTDFNNRLYDHGSPEWPQRVGIAEATLANGLSSGLRGSLDPLFQIGRARTIQFALRVSF